MRSWVKVAKNIWNPDKFSFRGKEANKLLILFGGFETNDQVGDGAWGEQITNSDWNVAAHGLLSVLLTMMSNRTKSSSKIFIVFRVLGSRKTVQVLPELNSLLAETEKAMTRRTLPSSTMKGMRGGCVSQRSAFPRRVTKSPYSHVLSRTKLSISSFCVVDILRSVGDFLKETFTDVTSENLPGCWVKETKKIIPARSEKCESFSR